MSETTTPTNTPLWAKILGSIFVGIILLATLVRVSLNTDWVRHKVKNVAVDVLGNRIDGEIEVGALEGDLWKEAIIKNVRISNTDQSIEVEYARVEYAILSFISGPALIKMLDINGINAQISETERATVTNLLIEQEEESPPFFFTVDSMNIADINARLYAPGFLPDSTVEIQNGLIRASFGMQEQWRVELMALSFSLKEGRLPEPIAFSTSASVLGDEITLNELVIGTGRTFINAKANAHLKEEELEAKIDAEPLSLADISALLQTEINPADVQLRVSAEGSFQAIELRLEANHPALKNIELGAVLGVDEEMYIRNPYLNGEYIDIGYFLGDSTSLTMRGLTLQTTGELNTELSESDVEWDLELASLQISQNEMQSFRGNGFFKENKLQTSLKARSAQNEEVSLSATVVGATSDQPEWKADLALKNIQPENWLPDTSLAGSVTVFARMDGKGFRVPENNASLRLTNQDPETNRWIPIEIAGETIDEFTVEGMGGTEAMEARSQLQVGESTLELEVSLQHILTDKISYSYALRAEKLNTADVNRLENFTTSISGEATGYGSGISLQNGSMFGEIRIDTSTINGAELEEFKAAFELERGILLIREGVLQSEIADGRLFGRKNIMDITDPDNRLSLDIRLIDPQPLAALVAFDSLQATGTLKGDILQDSAGILTGDFQLNLSDLKADSLFLASSITGQTKVIVKQLRDFDFNLNIGQPQIQGVQFQDIELTAQGTANADTASVQFWLDVVGSERGRLEQVGTIEAAFGRPLIDVQFNRFDFITQAGDLTLQEPFRVRIVEEGFGTDTLKLNSKEGAFLEFAIPYASENEQYAFLDGENFNFGLTQDILFGERFLDGFLSGKLVYNQSPEEVNADAKFTLAQVNYKDTEVDSVVLDVQIAENRMEIRSSISWDGERNIVGWANVPFNLDNTALDDAFYEQPVRGALVVEPSSLSRFQNLMEDAGITNTDGTLIFDGAIQGTAGAPVFEGQFRIENATLSGIAVEKVRASFNYNNATEDLNLNGEILTRGVTAAELSIAYPFGYDFRTFEMKTPGENDSLRINAETNNLDLALFNDFLDDVYLTNLKGILNADLELAGTTEKITPNGFVRLTRSSVEVPFTGIRIQNIAATMEINDQTLEVKTMQAKSGPGTFTASGNIELSGLIPQRVDIRASSRQFQLANNNDMNLIIDLNSTLKGKASRPEASGNVTVRSGFYYLQDFGDELVEEVKLEEEAVSFAPFDSLAMDMVLTISDNFFVRSRDYLDLEMEMNGELDIQKETGGEMQLFGNLGVNSGYIRPLGKRFDIEQADLVFLGPFDNPEINVRSTYVPPTRQKGEAVTLYYVITGTKNDPEFKFESDPVMEQSDVICFTLFGKPCYSLESWQSVFAGEGGPSAKDVITDILLDEVETLATRELGVDVVQIDNSSANGATSIKTGWYLNEKTFFAIVNEITSSTPKTLFILEYILNENLDLILTQGDDARQGIDIRFQYDY
jgi:hypothetical protein